MLNEIEFEPNYNSYYNDVVNDFYSKALSNSIIYSRVSAYFSAKSICNISKGIVPFYLHGGKMKLIISADIGEEDYNVIKLGYERKEIEKIYNRVLEDFKYDELSDMQKDKIANVAFLISNNALEIKMAFKTEGIFHDKFGLIQDENNNCVYFRGSNNETLAAIEKNYESFDVTCSWLASEFEMKRISNARIQFSKLWNNEINNLFIIDLPEVIKNKILSYNRGKIVDNTLDKKLIICFDVDEGKKRLFATIGSNVELNQRNYTFKIDIKKFIDSIDNNKIYFKDSITYLKYRHIIEMFHKYTVEEMEKGNVSFVNTSNHLEEYMKNIDYKIQQRYELGTIIKEENTRSNETININFNEFKNTLNVIMERQLKEKQMWNAYHIVKMKNSANFSVPGAGKTTIVYGAFAYLSHIEKVEKLVVVGPKSSFLSWKNEFKLNFGDKKELKVCDIQEINKNELIEKSVSANLILINYEALPGIADSLKYIIKNNTMLVFDEVHKIKGIDKVRANVALEISENAGYKVCLTGTPIPNGYSDIYNLLKILYRDEYNDFFGFSTNFLKRADELDSLEINKKMYPFFCRITKKDLEVPLPDEDNILISDVSNLEQMLYQQIRKKYKHEPFTYYIRMMQAMSNPQLLLSDLVENDVNNIFIDDADENYLHEEEKNINIENIKGITEDSILNLIEKIENTSKFNNGISKIEELVKENKLVLVWGIFTGTLNKIKQILDEKNISCMIINGTVTDLKEREKIISQFLNKEFDVLITNPNTLAESVSLHSKCHDAIYFEYSFNYTHMAQSRDRINRLGLSENQYTRYYYLVCGNVDEKPSIDFRIYNRLKEKEEIMLKAIESGKLTVDKNNINEDILNLLKD